MMWVGDRKQGINKCWPNGTINYIMQHILNYIPFVQVCNATITRLFKDSEM